MGLGLEISMKNQCVEVHCWLSIHGGVGATSTSPQGCLCTGVAGVLGAKLVCQRLNKKVF